MPNLRYIIAIILEPLVDSGDPPLTACVVITNKIFAMLIDGIVCQVHVHITLSVQVCVCVHVLGRRGLRIWLG